MERLQFFFAGAYIPIQRGFSPANEKYYASAFCGAVNTTFKP